jgi:hypothetical protein
MVNLFGIRATDPNVMKDHLEPIGKDNNESLLNECCNAQLVVAAWGNHGSHLNRSVEALKILSNVDIKCFKKTIRGEPIHPLYQKSDSVLSDLK